MADLRNHSQPCFGDLHRPFQGEDGQWFCDDYRCPGGREVTINRRAAQIAVAEGISDHISAADDWEEWAAEALALVDLCLVAALEQV